MKRKIFLALFIVVLACMLSLSISAVEFDGVHYSLDTNNKVATVNTENRTATTEIVTIPSTITYEGEEYRVTKIANDAFYGNKSVKELRILSEYITAIPSAMIANTHGGALEKIYIDFSRITSIGSAGFNPSNETNGNSPKANKFYYYDARAFIENGTDVIITDPDFSNCTSIGAAAFQGANFERLTIPGAVFLKNQIFRASTIKELVIEGENRETIEYYVFNSCKSLEKITIKSRKLKSLSNDVFSGCSALKEIYIDLSKCTSIGGAAFIFNGSYDGGQTRTQWYNLEGEKIVDLTSMKSFSDRCFASSNLGSAQIIWPTAVESISDQAFRKCNITQPLYINGAEGKGVTLHYWAFNGNSFPAIFISGGVGNIQLIAEKQTTMVVLSENITIRSDVFSKSGSVIYYKSLAADTTFKNAEAIQITSGTINYYGLCGVIANVNGTTIGTVEHTTSDAIDNSLCPVGKVTVTTCKYCSYIVYSVDGEAVEKKEHTYNLVGSITYVSFYEMGFKTNKCECGAEKANEIATEPAIFEYKGISVSQYADANGNYSITQGYYINRSAYNAYVECGNMLDFGIVAAAKSISGTTPLTVENGKVTPISEKVLTSTKSAIAHDYMDIKVTGISTDKNGQELVMCVYVYDGETIKYLSQGTQGAEADTITINVG